MILESLLENGAMFAFVGAFAGFTAGVLGLGGGMVVVPALVYIFHFTHVVPMSIEMHMAAGTSLAIMLLTSTSAVLSHYYKQKIFWDIVVSLSPGIVAGVIAGALCADYLGSNILQVIFGCFLLLVSLKMFLDINLKRTQVLPKRITNWVAGFFIGLKSGLLGIGGGLLIIPYLTYFGIDPRKIPAISACCTFLVAVIGTIMFIITGWDEPNLPVGSLGYIYWPAILWIAIPSAIFAPIGARLTYVLPIKQLKYAFVFVLILAGIDMIF